MTDYMKYNLLQDDEQFAQYVDELVELRLADRKLRRSIFIHNFLTTIAFAILIAGIIYIAICDVASKKNLITAGLVIYAFCVYRLINKSYANRR